MKNIIGKGISGKLYYYLSWGYYYVSTGYFFCKKILYSLFNELNKYDYISYGKFSTCGI
ncbi:hypothetical protein [Clostridium sp. JN-1]|jgi:hypothetical protein|uniref:hypothetical protein n=1 Tax=Clostridium sp. JN-1 TaxID=2483110 RepID=UPI001681448F|nr:hypothetical protein [Clostridium sp. JN-1]